MLICTAACGLIGLVIGLTDDTVSSIASIFSATMTYAFAGFGFGVVGSLSTLSLLGFIYTIRKVTNFTRDNFLGGTVIGQVIGFFLRIIIGAIVGLLIGGTISIVLTLAWASTLGSPPNLLSVIIIASTRVFLLIGLLVGGFGAFIASIPSD